MIGDPDTCIETLEQYEKLGVDGVMCSLQQGPTTHEEAINTIRLFGKYVIPHFKVKEQKSVAARIKEGLNKLLAVTAQAAPDVFNWTSGTLLSGNTRQLPVQPEPRRKKS